MRGREGVLFLPDGTVTHQTGWDLQHLIETTAYKDKRNGPDVFKKGNYSTLILYWGLGYYHWFKDVLAMLHRSLELMPKNTIFLMPKEFHKVYGGEFYLKSLQALGIDRDHVMEFDGTESWIFENFWWQPPAVHPGDQTPGATQWIGQRVSKSVPVKPDEKKLRVYISRAVPYARILANEEEILPALMEMGFQVFRLEEMPFDEQVRVFRNAEIVVGPHGAGFTNLIFSKPGTHVVEILAKGYERRCYWTLSDELGHDYRFYLGEPKFPERKGEPDIEIDASNFLRIIKNNFIESGLIRKPKA
jgi:capsular polysaccharide biosynthesis protein